MTYRAGDVRLSSASDRHFLTVAASTLCLVIGRGVPGLGCGSRRIVHLDAALMHHLATCHHERLEDAVAALTQSTRIREAAERTVPAWLAEFEDVRLAGRLVTTRGIDTAARMAGVSREHLARSYRRHFGTTVTDAIKARRLHAAWDALTRSATGLADIADESGFSDQSHMTRHFSEWIGLTPAAVRRAAHQVTRLQDGTLTFSM